MPRVHLPPPSLEPRPGDPCDGCGAPAQRRVPFVRGGRSAEGYVLLCHACQDFDTVYDVTAWVVDRGWCRG